jgi:hypothetical protein
MDEKDDVVNIDLRKLREEYVDDYEPTEEDIKLMEEQKVIGQEIDSAYKREMELRNNPEQYKLNDFTKILYRLPITDNQREEIYNNLIKESQKIK